MTIKAKASIEIIATLDMNNHETIEIKTNVADKRFLRRILKNAEEIIVNDALAKASEPQSQLKIVPPIPGLKQKVS